MSLEKNLKFNPDTFTVPGKTFLVGEYAVLSGGSCLGLATSPVFSISLNFAKHTFHPDSPAGLYLRKNQLFNFAHELTNPYGVGGFGASTAEFIFSYFSNPQASRTLADIFSTYLELYRERQEQKPSGADLVTQLVGGISHIDLSAASPKVESLSWHFSDLDFLIFSTGLKVKTHEHLAALDRKLCAGLVAPSNEVITAFKSGVASQFKAALYGWSKNLEQLGLTAPEVLQLKSHLEERISGIQVKPCGALGADVIIILVAKEQKQSVLAQISALKIPGLKFQADSSHLVNGPLSI